MKHDCNVALIRMIASSEAERRRWERWSEWSQRPDHLDDGVNTYCGQPVTVDHGRSDALLKTETGYHICAVRLSRMIRTGEPT